MYRKLPLCSVTVLGLASTLALAAVSPEKAAELGRELTPIGAEQAGNAAGTIPPWTGGLKVPPAGYQRGDHHGDPFAEDPILYTITAANMDRYAAHLSEGQKALLQAYPDTWRMNVYRTRRSASFPNFILDATVANATRAEIVGGLGGVMNAEVGIPFPIPQSGVEVVWNHNLRWRGIYVKRVNGRAPVTRLGFYRVVLLEEEFAFPYSFPGVSAIKERHPNVAIALRQKAFAPGRLAGAGQLVLEPVNNELQRRASWSYSPDLRRVFRNPFIGYNSPALLTDSLRFNDEFDMYNGATDRFEWKLVGKQELYIPYNAYRLHSGDLRPSDILHKRHINPDLCRYELHRVWVVEGTARAGKNHSYSKRVFYFDEDTWQIAATDNYGKDGKLWRTREAHIMNYYEVPVTWTTLEVYQDLKVKRYLATGLDNHFHVNEFSEEGNPKKFSPNALNYYVR